jgi:hypothetical protein
MFSQRSPKLSAFSSRESDEFNYRKIHISNNFSQLLSIYFDDGDEGSFLTTLGAGERVEIKASVGMFTSFYLRY